MLRPVRRYRSIAEARKKWVTQGTLSNGDTFEIEERRDGYKARVYRDGRLRSIKITAKVGGSKETVH